MPYKTANKILLFRFRDRANDEVDNVITVSKADENCMER